MSLDDHLGSDQHGSLFLLECFQNLPMPVLISGSIRIHPQYTDSRKPFFYHCLNLLGPCLKSSYIRGTAFRALGNSGHFISAVMTHQPSMAVLGQSHITMGTFHYMAAGSAGYKSCIPSAVQEQHDLFVFLQALFHGPFQFPAQNRTVSMLHFFPQIHNTHSGQTALLKPLFQNKQTVISFLTLIIRLQRRGCRTHDHKSLFRLRPVNGRLSGMVSGRMLTFVGTLMLFVYYDKS